jgi:hypothetical protein
MGWLGHYATSREVAAELGPGVYVTSNGHNYQKNKRCFGGVKRRRTRKADNISAICERLVYTMWDPQYPATL